jgi:hypothetical protein
MAAVVFLCPNTGERVQGWFADDGSGDSETYQAVTWSTWSIRSRKSQPRARRNGGGGFRVIEGGQS